MMSIVGLSIFMSVMTTAAIRFWFGSGGKKDLAPNMRQSNMDAAQQAQTPQLSLDMALSQPAQARGFQPSGSYASSVEETKLQAHSNLMM